ncbi:MAG: hypothetical protein ACI8WP_001692 [Flavobacteriaceae bacterium]
MIEKSDLINDEKKQSIVKYSGLKFSESLSQPEAQSIESETPSSNTKDPSIPIKAMYLPFSDKILLSRNNDLKLVTRS